MKRKFWFFRSFITLSLLIISAQIYCQQKGNNEFKPEVGQEGKDVVWVPTPQALVEKMLDLAHVTPSDLLIDLGSGDGRTVITAAKRGVKAIGVEYNPDMVALSYKKAEKEGVRNKVEFVNGDLFEYDFTKATVITMFLLPDINLRLRPQILDMKPGTRIVSNTFTMGDWTPDDTVQLTMNQLTGTRHTCGLSRQKSREHGNFSLRANLLFIRNFRWSQVNLLQMVKN